MLFFDFDHFRVGLAQRQLIAAHRDFDRIAERIYHYPEVDEVYLMSGSFDFTVIIEGKSMREVATFVAEKLSPMESILSCSTHFVLKKYKDHGTVLTERKQDERMRVSP